MWHSGQAPLAYEPTFFDRYFFVTEHFEARGAGN